MSSLYHEIKRMKVKAAIKELLEVIPIVIEHADKHCDEVTESGVILCNDAIATLTHVLRHLDKDGK